VSAQPNFYRDLAYVFVAATGGGLIARWLRQPLILGYVLGGILIGPFTPGPTVSDVHVLELLAEVGVILLMYSIGIEFSLDDLRKVKWTAVIGGPLGILLSIGLGLGVGAALGWSTQQGIAIGATVSVASTMVLSRLLMDRGELQSPHGRLMIGITLIEDLAVVILTVLLPSAVALSGERLAAVALDIGKSLALLIPIMFVTAMVAPRLMAWVARMGSEELYLLIALALGLAVAAMTQAVGLSLALGAFLAGVVISGSEEGHKTLNKLLSLRDAFVALFFVTIGALVNPRALISNPSLLVVILGMIVVGKLAIWTTVVWVFRYPFRTAVLVGLGLTQIGEFSYVLAQVARKSSLIGEDVYNATLAASLISILLNAALMRFGSKWIVRE
jgi:monovalent cation:H+ antiporter-2, CPA2 family